MTFENINVEETIESVQEQMKSDKTLSLTLASSINLLILLIKILISRIGINSQNSNLPPSSNYPKRTRGKDKKLARRSLPIKLEDKKGIQVQLSNNLKTLMK